MAIVSHLKLGRRIIRSVELWFAASTATPRALLHQPTHAIASLLWLLGVCFVSVAADAQQRPRTRPASDAQPEVQIVRQIGHSRGVESIAISPDQKLVLTSSSDKTLKLWDIATARLLRTLDSGVSEEDHLSFLPDGQHALSAGDDKVIKLWNVVTGQLVRRYKGHADFVRALAVMPDGRTFLSGGDDKVVRQWDIGTGTLLRTFSMFGKPLSAITIHGDGSTVSSGTEDGVLTTWDVTTGRVRRRVHTHTHQVSAITLAPDGKRALTASWDSTFKLWELGTGALLRTFASHKHSVQTVAFSSDARAAISVSWDNTIHVTDLATGALILKMRSEKSPGSYPATFTADRRHIIIAGEDGATLEMRDAATGAIVRAFGGWPDDVRTIAMSPDGRLAVASLLSGTRQVWSLDTGRLLRTFPSEGKAADNATAISPSGKVALSGDSDGATKLWDLSTGEVVRRLAGHARAVTSLDVSADGRRAVSTGMDGVVRVWDLETGHLLRESPRSEYPLTLRAVALAPDGKTIAIGSWGRTLRLWDYEANTMVRTIEEPVASIFELVFTPDGRKLLTGAIDGRLQLWDVATGRFLGEGLGHKGPISALAIARNGQIAISSGSEDKTVAVWDLRSRFRVRVFAHTSGVHGTAISADGRYALAGSEDGVIRYLSLQDGRERLRLIGRANGAWLAMTPEGFFDRGGPADDSVYLVQRLQATFVDQVHQSLYNPDLVREAAAGDPSAEVAAAAKVVDLKRVLGSGAPPEVTLGVPQVRASERDVATVEATVVDRGAGVGRLEWRVNGVTSRVTMPMSSAVAGGALTLSQDLALDAGDNVIELIAYNGASLLASRPAQAIIRVDRADETQRPNLHVLAVGIDDYDDPGHAGPDGRTTRFGRLGLAVKDATAFAASMQRSGGTMYSRVEVRLALDAAASRDGLEAIVDDMATKVHPRDTFVLFVAAHGTAHAGRFFLIPHGFRSGPDALVRQAIGQDRIQAWLANRIQARKALILLDTCESGALIAGHTRSRVDDATSEAALGRLHEAIGRPVLTATAAGQFAHEGVLTTAGDRHGVFTWSLLQALKEGDANGNGLIELSELVTHVQSQVPRLAARFGGEARALVASTQALGRQSARFGSRGGDFALAGRLD